MAGAYCKFCGNRCFVYRIIPDGPQKGWAGHLATCAPGMAHDREKTGHDHTTATNPLQADVENDADDRECPTCGAPADETGTSIPAHRTGSPCTVDYRAI